MPDPTPTTRRDGNTPLKFSERHDRDWRHDFPRAWERGHETAAIYDGDNTHLKNPYPVRSGNWYAFTTGWNAWVLMALKNEAKRKREYEPPAIVYEGKLTARAGSRPCASPEHGCYDVKPEQLFGGG